MASVDGAPFAPEDVNTSEPVLAIWEEQAREALFESRSFDEPMVALALICEVRRLRKVVARVEALAEVWEKNEPGEGTSRIRAHASLTSVLEEGW